MLEWLFLGALGVSGTKAAIDNAKSMSKPLYKTEKGYDVYMDRQGRQYINGNLVYNWPGTDQYGNSCTVLRDKKGNIYSSTADREAIRQREWDDKNYKRAQESALWYMNQKDKNGNKVFPWADGKVYHYRQYYPAIKREVEIEMKTGRPYKITDVNIYDETGNNLLETKYYKGYYVGKLDNFGNVGARFVEKVAITEEEYNRLGGKNERNSFLWSYVTEGDDFLIV
jgi:hypothetical protein